MKHCDIAAVNGDDLIVIEMKLALNLSLLAQGVRRQQMTDSVYLAVPRPPNHAKWMWQMRGVFRVLRRLELGLLLVSLKPGKQPVEVVFHPLPFERRKRRSARRAILEEIGVRGTSTPAAAPDDRSSRPTARTPSRSPATSRTAGR